jgi:FAD/FMN-containing dehydrogenase
MTHIGPPDPDKQRIQVGAGVVLGALNRTLAANNLFLPVIPGSHQAATVGGMIATDAAGLRAIRYGTMRDWVEEATLVDGLGRLTNLHGERLADAVGREGVTGFIVEARLRLEPRLAQRSVTIQPFDSIAELLDYREMLCLDPSLTALEYFNGQAADAIGWPPVSHLLAEFNSDYGEVREPEHIAEIWRRRDGLYPRLAGKGYSVIEDPQLFADGLLALLDWLEEEGIPAFGHLGLGIVHPCFRYGDSRFSSLYERVADWGGRVSGEHGVGLKKMPWVDETFRNEVRRLKEDYDPLGILNRGKLC